MWTINNRVRENPIIIVVALVLLQSFFYVYFFSPGIYDELQHYEFIKFYSSKLNPFISIQPVEADFLGEITRSPTYLYYFILSLPLRLIQFITQDNMAGLYILRAIHTLCFIAGIFAFKMLFTRVGFGKYVSATALLMVVLIPATSGLPGSVNYDNLIFLLTPLSFIYLLDVLDTNFNRRKILAYLCLGLFACLIKFSFAPIFLVGTIVIIFKAFKKRQESQISDNLKSLFSIKEPMYVVLVLLFVSLSILFVERPVRNFIEFGNPNSECVKILSQERCSANYIAKRNIDFKNGKPENFEPIGPLKYAQTLWSESLLKTTVYTGVGNQSLPIVQSIFSVLFTASPFFIAYHLRGIRASYGTVADIFVVTFLVYTGLFFVEVYTAYIDLGKPVAINFRYLLPVIPFFTLFFVESLKIYKFIFCWSVHGFFSVRRINGLTKFKNLGGC